MTYSFDDIIVRRATGSYKWDEPKDDDVLPMWVADMDFKTAPCIIDALQKRVSHGIFGYTLVTDDFYEAIIRWFGRRHGWRIERSSIMYTIGVVPALSAIIKALTTTGDKIIVQTPAYNCFFSSIRNNDCELSANELVYASGRYSIDYDDLERRAADPKARLLLLCNPHNPSGRVWTREELLRICDICHRNDVTIVSDEIHCELTYKGHDYTPLASIYDSDVITCVSPSKAFNIAGLQIAGIVTRNSDFRQRIDRAININEVCDVNPFGIAATIAAYNEGEEWLDELRDYLFRNYQTVCTFFAEHIPQCPILPLEGTYLVWINCRSTHLTSDEIARRLLHDHRLMVNPGSMYGQGGEGFIRLNIACPHAMVVDALKRLRTFFRQL